MLASPNNERSRGKDNANPWWLICTGGMRGLQLWQASSSPLLPQHCWLRRKSGGWQAAFWRESPQLSLLLGKDSTASRPPGRKDIPRGPIEREPGGGGGELPLRNNQSFSTAHSLLLPSTPPCPTRRQRCQSLGKAWKFSRGHRQSDLAWTKLHPDSFKTEMCHRLSRAKVFLLFSRLTFSTTKKLTNCPLPTSNVQ